MTALVIGNAFGVEAGRFNTESATGEPGVLGPMLDQEQFGRIGGLMLARRRVLEVGKVGGGLGLEKNEGSILKSLTTLVNAGQNGGRRAHNLFAPKLTGMAPIDHLGPSPSVDSQCCLTPAIERSVVQRQRQSARQLQHWSELPAPSE